MNPTDSDPPVATPPLPAADAPQSPATSADAAPAGESNAAAAPREAGADDGQQRRRNRNRRRGRRNRGERTALGEGAQPIEPAEGLADVNDDDDDDDDEADAQAPGEAAGPEWTPVEVGERFADVVSGAYDNEPAPEPEAEPAKRVLAAMPDAPKLHKVLAQAGVGSRRDMEQLIADGQISVNGQAAHIGQRIAAGDQIRVAGQLVKLRITPPPARVLAYHKPAGEIVTHGDPQNRPTVFRRLPRLQQGKWQSVGRLDINTEGLLLFTNSGDLANRLMHPRFGVEREYAVRVLGMLSDEQRARLLEGIEIDGQRAAMRSIEDGGGEGANHWYRVVITEGRNREVRRLFEVLGMAVSRLIRIRYGCVVLPRGLRRGVWVDLPASDLQTLQAMVGGAQAPGAQGGGNGRPNNNRNKRDRDRGGRGPREAGAAPMQEPRRQDGDAEGDGDNHDFASIPNPLQQTFDRRAIREARQPRREIPEDGPIPNPLEQTYDKRGVQKPRGLGVGGGGGGRKGGKGGAGGGERQPDPMQTSVGYIGADAFHKQMSGGGGGGGGGGRGRRRR